MLLFFSLLSLHTFFPSGPVLTQFDRWLGTSWIQAAHFRDV